MIACVQLADFAATLERWERPALHGQPLILASDSHVYAASGEAARSGVQPGMSLSAARSLCSGAQVMAARPDYYERTFSAIPAMLAGYGELVEPESGYQDATCYLDLGSSPRDTSMEIAAEIGRAARQESRMAPTVGVARGKFPARIAARLVPPNTARVIEPGQEATLLSPLPVETLPLDGEIARRLHLFGIRTIGQFAELPPREVLAQFGTTGQRLHRLARGEDDRPVQRRVATPSEEVEYHFEDPVFHYSILHNILRLFAESLSTALQSRYVAAKRVWLIARQENHTRRERRHVAREPLMSASALDEVLRTLLRGIPLDRGVVWLQVVATEFVPLASTGRQMELFPSQSATTAQLEAAIPGLLSRYGEERFYTIRPADPAAYLLERRYAWRPAGSG